MIRALTLALCLTSPAAAQTPVATSAANDLRVCLLSDEGFRDAARLAQLDLSLKQIRANNWGQLTQIAPGVYRMVRHGTDRTVEIKLPDANGAAHCLAFGPSISPGHGAMTADKFAELSFVTGLTPAAAPQGYSRRYSVSGAEYQADLVAYATGAGDVVGFVFSGVPQDQTTRALSTGNPTVTYRGVSTSLSNAVEVCLRNYVQRDTVNAALASYGFEFGFETGGSMPGEVRFTPDNAVSITHAPGRCTIETNYMSPAATVQITTEALNRSAPGGFSSRIANHSGCTSFYASGALNLPLSINVLNASSSGADTCIEDGTSRITFVVAG